jgi:LysM repeat protein
MRQNLSIRKLCFAACLALFFSSCKTTSYQTSQQNYTRQQYIQQFAPLAVSEMKRTGIPASIKLAQAILESGDGNSRLAKRANNHFGIKCHDWRGPRIYHDDDHRGECFRKYRSADASFQDHSDFLSTRSRYAFLFDLDPTDYAAWAQGLKSSGYATNPSYDRLLIRIIEENQLHQYDRGGTAINQSAPVSIRPAVALPIPGPPTESSPGRTVSVINHVRYVIARDGDSFESLAREFRLMAWELPRYNETDSQAKLREGDIVFLQPKKNRAEKGNEFHVVEEGETLYRISQLYGVKLDRLRIRNGLKTGEEPSSGQTIWLRRNKPAKDETTSLPEIEFEL